MVPAEQIVKTEGDDGEVTYSKEGFALPNVFNSNIILGTLPGGVSEEKAAELKQLSEEGEFEDFEDKINLAQGYLPDPLGSPNDTLAPATIGVLGLPPTTLEAAAMHRRVWLVLYQRTLDEAAKAGTVPASKAWLEQHYQGGLEQRIGDLRLYLYRTGV